MPVTVRKAPKGAKRKWLIVEKASGHVVGHSDSKTNAEKSARARNYAIHMKKG
jgi:hypothetical protein